MKALSPSQARGVLLLSLPQLCYWLLNGLYIKPLKDSPWAFLALDACGVVLLPAVTLMMLRRRYGIGWADLGLPPWRRGMSGEVAMLSIAAGFISFLGFYLLQPVLHGLLTPYDWYRRGDVWLPFLDKASSEHWAIAAWYYAITAAVPEELFFRGVLYLALRHLLPGKHQLLLYSLISGLAFGLGHWEQGLVAVVSITAMGVAEARFYAWSGMLAPLIVAHFVVDLSIFS